MILKINKSNSFSWNHFSSPDVSPRPLKDASKGQGDSSTKWKGWRSKLDIDFIV